MQIEILKKDEFDIEVLNSLNHFSPFSTQKFIQLFQESFGFDCGYVTLTEGKTPPSLPLVRGGNLVAVLPVIFDGDEIVSLGHDRVVDVFDYLPVAYRELRDVQELILQLIDYSKENNKKLRLSEIPVELVRQFDDFDLVEKLERKTIVPVCDIANNIDVTKNGKVIFKKKYRRELKRKTNKINKSFDEMRFVVEIDKDKYGDKFMEFFSKSGNVEKQEFLTDEMKNYMKGFVGMEEVKLTGLFLDGGLVSAAVYFDVSAPSDKGLSSSQIEDTGGLSDQSCKTPQAPLVRGVEHGRYLYNMASDVGLYEFSPGILHIYQLVLDTIENGFDMFNFLRGDERYKFEIGANCCRQNFEFLTD